jgi:hypothetical protein
VARDEHLNNLESYTTRLELTAYREGLLRYANNNQIAVTFFMLFSNITIPK